MKPKLIMFGGKARLVHPETETFWFRPLSEAEAQEFVAWARRQPEGVSVPPIWHPVVQDELLRSKRGRIVAAREDQEEA